MSLHLNFANKVELLELGIIQRIKHSQTYLRVHVPLLILYEASCCALVSNHQHHNYIR